MTDSKNINNKMKTTKMGKLRFLSFIFCAVAATTLTSCLDDDDDNGLTADERLECFNATRGEHSGKLIFRKAGNSTNVAYNDTVSAAWSITTDSTMTIYNVPSRAIASAIDTTTASTKAANIEAYNAIVAQPAKTVSCAINYYRNNPISWAIYPAAITYEGIPYGGKQCRVQILYYTNYCVGTYSSTGSSRSMQMQIVVAGANVDGTYTAELIPQSNARGLLFTETR